MVDVRTSTAALIVAFVALFWLYQNYEPPPKPPPQAPGRSVVPPGFVPDPNYTWVPRTQVQPRSTTHHRLTTPTTTTPTETTSPTRHHQRVSDHVADYDNSRTPGSSADVAVA